MYFLSLPFEIGGDLRDDGVDLLDDGVDLLSNAGRSSMTTISHFALLLWFEIGIWPPPLPPLHDFLPEIKKSQQTIHEGRVKTTKVGKVKTDKQIIYHVTAPMSEQFLKPRSDRSSLAKSA